MIRLDNRVIDDQGQVTCDTSALRESLYKHGSWTDHTLCQDSNEAALYNKTVRLLDSDYPLLNNPDTTSSPRWFTPEPWVTWGVSEWCLKQCTTDEQRQRTQYELEMFCEMELVPVLRHLKYLVEYWRSNNITWGVGRGSSISSYVLYLLGIHKIDPLLYQLDCTEFFKHKE